MDALHTYRDGVPTLPGFEWNNLFSRASSFTIMPRGYAGGVVKLCTVHQQPSGVVGLVSLWRCGARSLFRRLQSFLIGAGRSLKLATFGTAGKNPLHHRHSLGFGCAAASVLEQAGPKCQSPTVVVVVC